MKCPFCNGQQMFVVNSRPTKKDTQIWRRKRCALCNERFTTYEKIDLSYIKVIKKSAKKQRYERSKLYSGIYNAAIEIKGVDRGEMAVLSDRITNEIEEKIIKLRKKEISTEEIIGIVSMILSRKSPALLVRYLAYREGDDSQKLKRLVREYLSE